MKPIDPSESPSADPRTRMAPPYVDEDPEAALVQQGLDEAENETRGAVADSYETAALQSDDVSEQLDDIDYGENDGDAAVAPEIAAMHQEFIPLDDDEDE